jgi:Metallopeptidase toxin 4
MAHVKHFEQLGNAYLELSRYTREKYVWDQILANRYRWTERELKDALKYINGYCKAYGKPIITIK